MERRTAAIVIATIALLAGLANATLGAAKPSLSKVPDYDLQQLGFEFAPVPAGEAQSRVASVDAVAAASEALRMSGTPEVQRLQARIRPDDPKRTVWVVVYDGGDPGDVPWGPYSEETRAEKSPAYSGVLIDDVTGEVLVAFRGGSQ
jgi:hypothetical protein